MRVRSDARAPEAKLFGLPLGASKGVLPLGASEGVKQTLERAGLYGATRAIARPVLSLLCKAENALRAKGIIMRALVPEAEFFACQQRAISTLIERDPAHVWGDYLEFGVSQGHSLSLMYRALAERGLVGKVRLYGFDSFEGLPADANLETDNSFKPGECRAEIDVAWRLLRSRGVDLRYVELVQGWYSETLTPALRERVERVSIANFDCELYVSTAQALAFTAPLIGRSAIFVFDDWGAGEELAGQKKAFAEFLTAHRDIYAEELPNYSWESRVFYLSRGTPGPFWEQRVKLFSNFQPA